MPCAIAHGGTLSLIAVAHRPPLHRHLLRGGRAQPIGRYQLRLRSSLRFPAAEDHYSVIEVAAAEHSDVLDVVWCSLHGRCEPCLAISDTPRRM